MKTIGLVDFSHTLRVNYHVRPADGAPTQAGEYTLQQLSDWRRGLDHVIVCLDSPPYDRSAAYPEYKAGRARDEGYIQVCKWTKERLVKDGYSIASHPGAEADDVIATLADKLLSDHEAQDVRIFGGDKDCLQCVTEWKSGITARVFAPGPRGDFEIRDIAWVHQKWGIAPTQVPLFLAICGDKSDNIPGIMGIGEKGAAKLIQEFGTIEKMRMAAVDAFTASKQEGAKPLSAFWDNFLKGSPRLPEWLALTTLRTDLPLDVDALLVKRAPLPLVAESPEDIEHGDAWEPGAEELQEERATMAAEAKTEPPKAAAGPAESTPPARAPSTPPSAGTAPAAKPPRTSDEITSIVLERPASSWALQLQPSTAKEALQIASVLYNSRHYSRYGSEKGAFSAIMLGRELGLGAVASLMGLHIISDRPFLSANLMRALAETHQDCEWIMVVQADNQKATAKTKHRKAGELEYVYTRERAEQAGYFTGGNKANWLQKTQEMLEARCISKAVRRWYPSSVMGMHAEEEAHDD